MPLERIKTQVLLLHSEQTALDKLRAGFDDRYTVHCATSGFEALNTLGETPIHVIVSANALPGMSGAEALREAKKRSPETIGILLTGRDDKQIEALAGDKDIFQVIRGGVDPRHITQLVDAATQQVGQFASAANDLSADTDGTSENIVIETGNNGSTIISDGTGTYAALAPEQMAERLPRGATKVGILVMTKDEDFLASIKDCCRGLHEVHVANSIKRATELLTRNAIGVSIVDASLVGPNVEKLALHLQAAKKRLVPIVAGRREDGEMLMGLINRGKVYRFLLKPASPGRIRLALEASVKHHLEGPDSAFKKIITTDPQKPAAKTTATVQKKEPAPAPPAPSEPKNDAPSNSQIEQGLNGVFDDDDSRFASTVSMIVSGKRAEIQPKPMLPSALDLAEDDGEGSVLGKPMVLGGILLLVLISAIAVWQLSGSGQSDPAVIQQSSVADVEEPQLTVDNAESTVDPAPTVRNQTAPEPQVSNSVPEATQAAESSRSSAPVAQTEDSPLAAARTARDAGRLYTPAGNNALELYAGALAQSPNDTTVLAEFDALLDIALIDIETLLLEGKLSAVENGLDQITIVRPDHPRLPLLRAQLSNAQTRATLDAARDAIRTARFDDADAAIQQARNAGSSVAQVDALRDDLAAARNAADIERILERANAYLVGGQLIEPQNRNARALFEQVLDADPSNRSARQGLSSVAAKLVLSARADIDSGRLDAAERVLKQAAEIDASSEELEISWTALSDARNEISDQAAAAIEQEAQSERDATQAAAELSARPVPVSSLTRTRYVAPKYPRAAERRGLNGWVDLMFTVGLDGSVIDIDVIGSDPGEIFVSSAVDAVERWEFEPVKENGGIVEKRAVIRLGFALE